jgi:hypothetical protein
VATPQIAVAIAYPVVAQTAMDSLLPYDVFLVKQDSSILEMATSNAGCGCCEMSNKYAIYGIDANGQQKTLLLGQEDSSVLNRACCAPNHAFSMKFYETRGNSKAPNKTKGAVWTMEREGCCTKWLNCCPPIHACCQQEMKLYAGDVSGEVGKMEGTLIGRAEQPMPWGGCFTPTLHSKFLSLKFCTFYTSLFSCSLTTIVVCLNFSHGKRRCKRRWCKIRRTIYIWRMY